MGKKKEREVVVIFKKEERPLDSLLDKGKRGCSRWEETMDPVHWLRGIKERKRLTCTWGGRRRENQPVMNPTKEKEFPKKKKKICAVVKRRVPEIKNSPRENWERNLFSRSESRKKEGGL